LNPTTLSSDGGVYRLLPHDEDRGVAATIQAGGRSVLVVGTLTQGQLSAQPLLSVERPGLSHAVAGQNVGLLWAPGTSDFVFGAGVRPVPPPGLMTYGRCGVQVDNRLFVPAVGGSELKILVLEDVANTQPLTFTLSTNAAQLEAPCLAARGRELLVVANDADRALRMWTLTVDELLASAQAREVTGFPSRPGTRDVKNPVAVGTRAGWQLAWESNDATGGVIAEGRLSDQLVFVSGGQVSNGLDDRRPVLARSPNDDVVLVWEQFIDTLGAVIVRTRRLEQPNEADAGVPDGGSADAGLVDGGGVEPTDAGTPDGGASDGGTTDGGVSLAPVVFTACGCQGAGGPLLLSLALLLLTARRRKA
jgi:uncharacterized protein (TIGR03382 family)